MHHPAPCACLGFGPRALLVVVNAEKVCDSECCSLPHTPSSAAHSRRMRRHGHVRTLVHTDSPRFYARAATEDDRVENIDRLPEKRRMPGTDERRIEGSSSSSQKC